MRTSSDAGRTVWTGFLMVGLQLVTREATTVVVEHTVPALRVSVRAELGVAARVVVKAVDPALRVSHDELLDIRRRAGLGTRGPAVAAFPSVVRHSQPALGHSFLGSEDPPAALWLRVADVDARFDTADRKLIRVLAVVEEAPRSSAVAGDVREERLSCVADHSVLFDALRPDGVGGHY